MQAQTGSNRTLPLSRWQAPQRQREFIAKHARDIIAGRRIAVRGKWGGDTANRFARAQLGQLGIRCHPALGRISAQINLIETGARIV